MKYFHFLPVCFFFCLDTYVSYEDLLQKGAIIIITFLKINAISIIYAVALLIPLEGLLNVYRLNRTTGISSNVIWYGSFFIGIGLAIAALSLSSLLHMSYRKVQKVSCILWLPYFLGMVYLMNRLFPMTNEGDSPGPIVGFILIGSLLMYPFFLLITSSIVRSTSESKKCT